MMENGYDGKFAEKFSGLAISGAADPPVSFLNNNNTTNDSSLFQVMKAVEAAEATIKQQVDENIRLRTELQNKILELDRYVSLTDFPFLFHVHCNFLNWVRHTHPSKSELNDRFN